MRHLSERHYPRSAGPDDRSVTDRRHAVKTGYRGQMKLIPAVSVCTRRIFRSSETPVVARGLRREVRQEPMVRGLSAGASRIRTNGPTVVFAVAGQTERRSGSARRIACPILEGDAT